MGEDILCWFYAGFTKFYLLKYRTRRVEVITTYNLINQPTTKPTKDSSQWTNVGHSFLPPPLQFMQLCLPSASAIATPSVATTVIFIITSNNIRFAVTSTTTATTCATKKCYNWWLKGGIMAPTSTRGECNDITSKKDNIDDYDQYQERETTTTTMMTQLQNWERDTRRQRRRWWYDEDATMVNPQGERYATIFDVAAISIERDRGKRDTQQCWQWQRRNTASIKQS